MPARGDEFEVVIPVRVRDETQAGSKSARSSVEEMAADVAATRQQYEDEYQRALLSNFAQNRQLYEQDAQARLAAAQHAEQGSYAAWAREASAHAAKVNKESAAEEALSNKLTVIAAQRAAENERFANQTALAAQRARDREVEAARRAAEQERKLAEDAARQSAFSFENIFGATFFAGLAQGAVSSFFSNLKEGLVDTTLYAARTEELGVAVDAVAKAQHLNTAAVREQVQALKDANIATQGAEQALSKFIAVGLPLEKASPLAAVAKDLAVIAGVNSTEEFNTLVEGITTLQARRLRYAGAIVDVRLAEEEYGKTLGKNLQDMTSEEKQLAVLNKVLEYGANVTGTYEAAMGTASKQLRSLERVQQDYNDAVGKEFIPLMALGVKAQAEFYKIGTAGAAGFLAAKAGVALFTVAVIAMNTANLAALPIVSNVISSVKMMGQAMVGTAIAVESTAAATAIATAGWAALILVVAGVAYAVAQYAATTTEAKEATQEHIDKVAAQVETMNKQHTALQQVVEGAGTLQEQNATLAEATKSLTAAEQAHLDKRREEHDDNQTLAQEIQHIIDLRRQQAEVELRATSNLNVAALAGKLQDIYQNKEAIKQLNEELERLERLKSQTQSGGAASLSAEDLTSIGISRSLHNVNAPDFQAKVMETLAEKTREADAQINNLSVSNTKLGDEARNLASKQDTLNTSLGQTTTQAIDQSAKVSVLTGNIDGAKYLTTAWAVEQGILSKAVQTATNSIDEQIAKIYELTDAQRQGARRSFVKGILAAAAENADGKQSSRAAVEEQLQDPKVREEFEKEKRVQENLDYLEEQYGLKRAKRTREHKSNLDKLDDSYKKLIFTVSTYNDLTTHAFDVRFSMETLERVKKDFEAILNLRQQMGLALREPLPHVTADARTAEERATQATEIETLRATVRAYESLKRVYEPVTQAALEQQKAVEGLAVARQVQEMPVVGALTRAEVSYAKSVRESREEIQALGAEVIVNARRMADAEKNSAETTARAYLEVSKSWQERQRAAEEAIRREDVFARSLQNPDELRATVQHELNLKAPEVPSEMVRIAQHAATIDANVAGIALHFTARDNSAASGGSLPKGFNAAEFLPQLKAFLNSIGAGGAITAAGQSATHNRLDLDHRNAIDVGIAPGTVQGRALEAFLDAQGVPYSAFAQAGHNVTGPHHHIGELSHSTSKDYRPGTMLPAPAETQRDADAHASILETLFDKGKTYAIAFARAWVAANQAAADDVTKTDSNTLKGFVDETTVKTTVADEAEAARKKANNEATVEIWTNEALLGHQLIDLDKDIELNRSRLRVQRETEERKTALSIIAINDEIRDLDAGNAEAVHRQQQRVDEARGQGRMSLRDEVARLNDEIAHNGEDAALREEKAYLSAVRGIQQAHNAAAESIIADQVKIADATIYSADIANARVLDYLASQKSITDIIADAKINVIDTTFGAIDAGLERANRKFGVMGDILKQLESGLIKLALTPFFQALFGGGAGGGGGASGGGLLGGVFGGGSASSGGGGGLFGGNAGGGIFSLLGGGGGGGGLLSGLSLGGGGGLSTANLSLLPILGAHGATASDLSRLALDADENGVIPPSSLTSLAQQSSSLRQALSVVGSEGGRGLLGGGGFSLGAIGQSLAGASPLLGLTLGASLGGQSGLGQILGGAGGLLAGLGLLGGLSAATLGGIGGGLGASIATTAGGIFGIGSGFGGLFASAASGLGFGTGVASFAAIAGPLAAIAAPLIIGAILLSRNAARRRDETTRDAISNNTGTAIWALIDDARFGNVTRTEAEQRWHQIDAQYHQSIAGIKDSKTKRHAELQWTNDFAPLHNILDAALKSSEERDAFKSEFVPTFDEGGAAWTGGSFRPDSPISAYFLRDHFDGLVPGVYDRRDDKLIRVTGREVVLKPDDWMPIRDYLASRRVKGFADGGGAWTPTTSAQGTPPSSSAASAAQPINLKIGLQFVMGREDASHIGLAFATSDEGRAVNVEAIEEDIAKNGMDGVLGSIVLQMLKRRLISG